MLLSKEYGVHSIYERLLLEQNEYIQIYQIWKETTMRMLLQVRIPHAEFNAAVRDGSAEKKMKQILEQTKPEAVYFTEYDGRRGAIMIINIDDPS